jgi:hypothetical protein
MLFALKLTQKNIDHIAPEINWTRSELAEYYETNEYYDKSGYVVLDKDGDTLTNFYFVAVSGFNEHYMFTTFEHESEFSQVINVA